MPKTGFEIPQEFFQHTDPVSGQTKTFMRNTHARQSSPRLLNLKKCVAERMRGQTFRSGNTKQDSQAVREAFAQAAKSCARGG